MLHGAGEPLTRADWVNIWLAIAGLVLTVLGFGLAIWQLARTANASKATQKAVQRTERRMALNHLLVLLPQFRILEQDLDAAVEGNDRHLAKRTLVSFSYMVSEISGIISNQDDIDPSLPLKLQSLGRAASHAKAEMVTSPTKLPKTATKAFRDELVDINTYVGSLVGQFRIEPEGSH